MTGPPAGGRGPSDGDDLRFGDTMTGIETLMWRLGERHPRLRATMSLVVGLDRAPSVEAVRNRLEALTAAVPRLRQRVRPPMLAMLPPAWEADPAFSVDHHLAVIDGPLWEVAEAVVGAPFDDGRPPWRAVVVPAAPGPASPGSAGHLDDRHRPGPAVVLHLHHSYTDGLGGMRLVGELFDLTERADRQGAAPAPPAGDWAPGGTDILGEVGAEVRRVAALWARSLPWAAATLASAQRDPARFLGSAADVLADIEGHTRAALGPASPLLAARSAAVRLSPLDMPLDGLRTVAARIGVTVNDVFVAGLLEGMERYHAKQGRAAPSLRLGVPISSRAPGAGMHNQIFGAVLRGPLGAVDFDERARLVHHMVRLGRRQPWAAALDEAAGALVRLPGGVGAAAAAMSSLDVVASNVAGPPATMWLAGAAVTSMTPIGPRSGAALNATLLSYAGTATVGLNVDPAAVGQPGVLSDCLAAAFDEVLAAA